MDVFAVHERLVEDYRAFTTSFVEVHDERLKQHVSGQSEQDSPRSMGSVGEWLDPRVARLVEGSWREDRSMVRAEVDAAMFHLYGVGRDDVDYILETFPIVKRKDEKAFGEFRTKALILEAYDRLAAEGMVSG